MKIFLAGVSLGANNCPVIVRALDGHRQIDGIFGFQASIYGVNEPITPNCAFAHEAVSDNPLNFGLGSRRWVVTDKTKTDLKIIDTWDLHPGDWNLAVQDAFLADMKRIMGQEKASLFGIYGMFGHAADPVNFEVFLRRTSDIGVAVHGPYRDYETQRIVNGIMALPR